MWTHTQFLRAPYYLWHALNAKFKIQHCPWFHFCLRIHKSESDFYTFWILKSERSFSSFKLLDGHIRKWVMNSGFLYPEWCAANDAEDWDPELIYVWHQEGHLCCPGKLLNGETRKWHISYGFVYPVLWFDLRI